MAALYEMEHPADVAEVLEEARRLVAKVCGVTLTGNRLTLRWTHRGYPVSVHTIIESVTTPAEAADRRRYDQEMSAIMAKYEKVAPDLAAELHQAGFGEWLQ